jgi:hypothetical protein
VLPEAAVAELVGYLEGEHAWIRAAAACLEVQP